MYVIIPNIILAIKSYTKNVVKSILLACTKNADTAIYMPNFCLSLFSGVCSLGLNINIMAINNNELNKKVSVPFKPKLIVVPIKTAIYNILTGILLLHAAANIASPNGVSSLSNPTIETKKDMAYKTISFIFKSFLKSIFL